MTDPFWIIWNPAGHRPPSYRHATEDSAVAEAGRLAGLNPGETFYVLSAIGLASADKPVPRFMSLVFDGETGDFKGTAAGEAQVGGLRTSTIHVYVDGVRAPLKKPRVLKHGEYQRGDRVRYTGRGPHARGSHLPIGIGGRFICTDVGQAHIYLDDGQWAWISYPSIEHESLPQFDVGDRVRAKAAGLTNVRRAAGKLGIVTETGDGAAHIEIRFDAPVTNDHGHDSRKWYARASDIELVRPVQAGGGS